MAFGNIYRFPNELIERLSAPGPSWLRPTDWCDGELSTDPSMRADNFTFKQVIFLIMVFLFSKCTAAPAITMADCRCPVRLQKQLTWEKESDDGEECGA